MIVPEPPSLTHLKHISPSIYEASITCLAKGVWFALGDTGILPQHPAAILGTAFHVVVGAAHNGKLLAATTSDHSVARELFDKTAGKLHLGSHPLLKLKFPSEDRLPFYNLKREQAAIAATRIAESRLPARSAAGSVRLGSAVVRTESRLRSKDGRLVGRPDHIDERSGVVVDYKTGHLSKAEACAVSDSEARQLRLYAFLASENGIEIGTGAVMRGDGRYCEIAISPAEAEVEMASAIKQLRRLNSAASEGASFGDLASPSPTNCSFCPCLPFCVPFWAMAQPEWSIECGTHVEGSITEMESRRIQGISLTTLALAKRAGTVSTQRILIEQIPTNWMRLEGLDLPRVGDTVRVVHGRKMETERDGVVIKVDKTSTALWRLRHEDTGGYCR